METLIQNLLANGVFLAVLGWLFNRYMSKLDATLQKLTDQIAELNTVVRVHANILSEHEKDLARLEKKS